MHEYPHTAVSIFIIYGTRLIVILQTDHWQSCPPTYLPTFNGLGLYLDALGGELDSNRGLGVEVELVPSEARQQI